jgi:hypothetical protein
MVGKRPKLAAVDTTHHGEFRGPLTEPDRQFQRDERDWRLLLRRERSSAYWFAATKWGMLGLILGMIIGGGGMYVASIATLPMAQEALFKGAAMRDAQDRAANNPSELPRLTTPPAPAPAP